MADRVQAVGLGRRTGSTLVYELYALTAGSEPTAGA